LDSKHHSKGILGSVWQGLAIAAILFPCALLLIYALKHEWFSLNSMIFALAIICILMGIGYAVCGMVFFSKNNINKYVLVKKYIVNSLFLIAVGITVLVF